MSAPHATTVGPKQEIREGHLRLVQASSLWRKAKGTTGLTRDWLELTYVEDPTFRMLLDAGGLQPGQGAYLGVNFDEQVIEVNRNDFKSETTAGLCRWFAGDALHLLDRPEARNVGVLIFDAYKSVTNTRLIHTTVERLIRFANQQRDACGQFIFSCTFSLRGNAARDRAEGERLVLRRVGEGLEVTIRPEDVVYYKSGPRSQTMMMFRVWLK